MWQDKMGTNRTYLSRFFNQEKQMTFFDYVNNLRVEHAVGLLKNVKPATERHSRTVGI